MINEEKPSSLLATTGMRSEIDNIVSFTPKIKPLPTIPPLPTQNSDISMQIGIKLAIEIEAQSRKCDDTLKYKETEIARIEGEFKQSLAKSEQNLEMNRLTIFNGLEETKQNILNAFNRVGLNENFVNKLPFSANGSKILSTVPAHVLPSGTTLPDVQSAQSEFDRAIVRWNGSFSKIFCASFKSLFGITGKSLRGIQWGCASGCIAIIAGYLFLLVGVYIANTLMHFGSIVYTMLLILASFIALGIYAVLSASNMSHRIVKRATQLYSSSLDESHERINQIESAFQHDKQRMETIKSDKLASVIRENESTMHGIKNLIRSTSDKLHDICRDMDSGCMQGNWKDENWNTWEPSTNLPQYMRLGALRPKLPRYEHHFPNSQIPHIPLLLDYQHDKGLLIFAESGQAEAKQMVQGLILRSFATIPPGGVKFTFIDPISLGGNVAAFMAFEKHEPTLIGGKAWSDPRHIEQALTEITEHMETVIQKYLLEDYKTIAEYNAKARVKEAYRFIVVFDFPANFTENSTKRLVSILRNGARCGVFPIVVADSSKSLPYGIHWENLTDHAKVFHREQISEQNEKTTV